MSASCVVGDRVVTCSAFWSAEMSVTPCKIQGEIVTCMLDADNLDDCITRLIILSSRSPLARAVPGGWATQTVLVCPVVQGGQVLWF